MIILIGDDSHSGQTALKKSSPEVMALIWVIPTLQTILGLGDSRRILPVLPVFPHPSIPNTHSLEAFPARATATTLEAPAALEVVEHCRVMLPLGRCPSRKDGDV